MKTIPLTQGKVALVDDEDFDRINQYQWYAIKIRQKRGWIWYARRLTKAVDGPRKAIYMHRDILNAPRGSVVDHDDFDGLNNQKSNLKVCSYSENGRKRRKTVGTHSRFKGVTWNNGHQKWMAGIKYNGKAYTLGYSHEEEDCAILFDVAAQILFGDYAHLNGV